MEKVKKLPTERGSPDLLDTKELASALPDGKEKETRPKYVQVLQDKSGQRPFGEPNASSTDTPVSTKNGPRKKFQKYNKYQSNKTGDPNEKQTFRVYLKKQEVIPLPADLPTREFSVSPDNVHCFSGPNNYLSALYPSKFIVDGNSYNSVEHYYQACKLYDLVGKEIAAELKEAATPIEVKKMTKTILKGKVSSKAISDWKTKTSIPVLKYAVTEKFAQNSDLKEALLKTDNKILIQTYIGDNYYAVGAGYKFTTGWVVRHVNQSLKVPADVSAETAKYVPLIANGKNVLGWILMQVREELRDK